MSELSQQPLETNESDKPHEFCGVFGIFNHPEASVMTYYGLHSLQHRGQEAAGIVTADVHPVKNKPIMSIHKGFGLVTDVFNDPEIFKTLTGHSAIGHNRYSTSGSSKKPVNIQPFYVNYKWGNLALAHNGNLSNARTLRHRLSEEGTIFQSTTDTEIILHLMAKSNDKDLVGQIMSALKEVQGAYCLVILTDNKLIAVRDPHGFRPLSLGKLGDSYVVASETCAFDIIGAEYIREIEHGEMLVIEYNDKKDVNLTSHFMPRPDKTSKCIFEFVYFSRPDSKIFGESVDKVRRKLGKNLANEHPVVTKGEEDKVIVFSVPDSSNTATLGYVTESQKQGINARYEIGLIRNHYVGRTFIQPEEGVRELKVRTKFNTVKGVIEGRKVVVVDDSIVRGTTSKLLMQLIKEANPSEIHFRVSSPPIKHPCYYGLDFPDPQKLIANQFGGDIDKIRDEVGVTSLKYLSLEGMLSSVGYDGHPDHSGFCTACFSGKYPVPPETGVKKEDND